MKNSYSKGGFILANVYWYFIAWLWYKGLIYRPIDGVSYTTSNLTLVAILMTTLLIGYITQRKNRLNSISILMNTMMGFGIYTTISHYEFMESPINATLVIVLFLILFYAIRLLLSVNKRSTTIKKHIRMCLVTLTRVSLAFIAMGMVVIMGATYFNMNTTYGLAQAKSVNPIVSSEEPIANNMDTLNNLKIEIWDTLNTDERLDILQTIANIECRYLGLPHELTVVTKYMERYSTLGCYSDLTHTISVNTTSLLHDDPSELIDTICHEAYHAYQHRLVDMYTDCSDEYKNLLLYRRVDKYHGEFLNYTSGNDDYDAYYNQACEEDAREYAESAVSDYYNKINGKA